VKGSATLHLTSVFDIPDLPAARVYRP